MSAPGYLDALRVARTGASLEGELGAEQLPRLLEHLTAADAAVQYRIAGGCEAGRPVLSLWVAVDVRLVCQRCLEPYQQHLELRNVLPIARNAEELLRWEADDPLLDALVAEERLDLAALVEDEILLSLPLAPRHPEGECDPGCRF